MRKNTQKLLLALYPTKEHSLAWTYEQISLIWGTLTSGGMRSQLLYLDREGYILRENYGNKSMVVLTNKGKKACERLFPSLSFKDKTWQGEWRVLVFLKAPAGDNSFRYLREQLLADRAYGLTRGVFIKPGELSPRLTSLLEQSYSDSVVLLRASEWLVGNDRSIIMDKLNQLDVIESYSGISREIATLLSNLQESNSLTDQQKQQFTTIFERFFSIIGTDLGISRYYYQTAPTALELLSKLQTAMSVIGERL